jgi:multidrug efflux pump subunit AcrB
MFILLLGIAVVYLVLAAQFESGVHPFVILSGVLAATLFTPFVVPVAYDLLARRTGSPGDVARRLEREAAAVPAVADSCAH